MLFASVCGVEMLRLKTASWAVLPASRSSSIPITVQNSGRTCGFRTGKLIIQIDKTTLALTIQDASGNKLLEDARPIRFDGDAFRIYKTMPGDEHYFGLGDKIGPLDRRNQAFTLWNTDAYRFQETTDPIYKSIPYFMTYRAGRAAGILFDNTWRSSFDFGKETPDAYSFGAAGGPIDYYFFFGPTPKQVVETYAWLTGTPPLPPLWSFGYQQSRYSYMSQARVLEVAGQLRADHIPADAVYLDIDFQEKNRPFTVDKAAFPDLPGMVAKLKADHFHVVSKTDLHIANLLARITRLTNPALSATTSLRIQTAPSTPAVSGPAPQSSPTSLAARHVHGGARSIPACISTGSKASGTT